MSNKFELSHVMVDNNRKVYLVSKSAETLKAVEYIQDYKFCTIRCVRNISITNPDNIIFLRHANPNAEEFTRFDYTYSFTDLNYPEKENFYISVAEFLEGEGIIDVNLDSIWELPTKGALSYNYDY